ncbi:lysine--tRNA ligase [Candidatus Woesearchaeota archaeon]|nr:lysine--tRNA ligase [Candidatus Woesearchaeota archaeon]
MAKNGKGSAKQDKPDSSLFWADQIADEIINRKDFHYDKSKKVPEFKEFVVKTSASLSGVLHIGRLSDTIRSASVHKALLDAGVKSRLIWVSEDMDPLRKVPKGIPPEYEKYLGTPVTEVPDPDGCHKSYADHHREEYLRVIDQFVDSNMDKFSMREEYKKGNFREQIKKIIDNAENVKDILRKYRDSELPKGWSPFTPICENCGKIATPSITKFEDGKVHYLCQDYKFQTTTAKGCGHKGVADPLKDPGKLMWKSEWASQWDRWNVCSEGAGKEYQVPNSAFWVNAEICEKVLEFPHPVPIFYEHLMIDNKKMSASLGNVVYPSEWLEVATPELLRLFYNKRLMKTRSFSWTDLPKLYDEFDHLAELFSGNKKMDNVKKEEHIHRLFDISHGKKARKPLKMRFSHAVLVSQLFEKEQDMIDALKKTGHWEEDKKKEIIDRLDKANAWLRKYAPEDAIYELQSDVSEEMRNNLSDKQKKALHLAADKARDNDYTEEELHNEFYRICEELDIPIKDFFKGAYMVLLKRERGPKLASFILTLGERALELFRNV